MASNSSYRIMSRDPLKRLSSPMRSLSAVLHIIGIISFTLSYKYLHDFPSFINDSYGWHWQFLTILGLTVAYATFIFGLVADITHSPDLFFVKNCLALCSAPLEILISILYWSISAIDRRLLIPPGVELAPWADIGFHLMPSLLLTTDLLIFSPPWTIKAFPAMGLSTAIALGYWVWLERCYKFNGFYPYPLLEQLNTVQRVVLFGGAALLMTGCTMLLKWIYGKVNGLQGQERGIATGHTKREKNL